MIQNKSRVGNFTSSEIGALMKLAKDGKSFGAPALTFIEECNMERRLGRSLTSEVDSRPTSWGNFVEARVFDLLGTEYQFSGKETVVHPEIHFWAGSPDGQKNDEGKTVFDIKCPLSLKSFCQFVDATDIEEIRANHKDGDKYFWQLVSNAVLIGAQWAELIVYVPYKRELAEIREETGMYHGDQNKIAWINWANDDDLPYLIEGGHYKNLNIIRFPVLDIYKEQLKERVLAAGQKLIEPVEIKEVPVAGDPIKDQIVV